MATTLAVGFALAVQPVSAETIKTDTGGLLAGEVKIPVSGGVMPAYRARPAAGGAYPVVLVVQEIFGVHEHIKDLCRRFAKAGYLAVAPELYARQGDVSKISDWKQIFAEVVSKVPDAQVMSDLDATAAWAKSQGGNTGKLGIVVYFLCLGIGYIVIEIGMISKILLCLGNGKHDRGRGRGWGQGRGSQQARANHT